MLLSGCASGVEEVDALSMTNTTPDVSTVVETIPSICTPAYEYQNVLPFRIELTKSGKFLCHVGKQSVCLLKVNNHRVTLNDVAYGFYPVTKDQTVQCYFKRKDGSSFSKSFSRFGVIETVSNSIETSNPLFNCMRNGVFVKYSDEEQKVRVHKECGAVKRARVVVKYNSSLDYPNIALDVNGFEVYPVCVSDGKAVFTTNYLPCDFDVVCPIAGVEVEKISVSGYRGKSRCIRYHVRHPKDKKALFKFDCKDLTTTAKIITPLGDVLKFNRESISTGYATYSAKLDNVVVGKYKIKLYSKNKCKNIRVEFE